MSVIETALFKLTINYTKRLLELVIGHKGNKVVYVRSGKAYKGSGGVPPLIPYLCGRWR